MSSLFSCFNSNVYHKNPRLIGHKRYFESIFLTQSQVRDLYSSFCQVDHANNNNDVATCEDLFTFFDVNQSMFSKRAVRSALKKREISFLDFVLSVWNYCTADVDTMTDLCFRMYLPQTLDYADEIEGSDVKQMLKDLYGDNYLLRHPKLSVVQKKLVSLNDVPINLEQFQEFCKSHDLLTPAFQTQSRLRTILLGQKFWTQAMKKRKSLEVDFAFKNDFKLEHQEIEKYFDLPRKPKWAVGVSSVQNHGRGSETLTAKVHQAQAKKKGERRRSSFSKEKEGEGEVEEEEGGGSIRDHPSLRMRRKSWDEGLEPMDRTTKLEFQKHMDPTEHELALAKRDVLSLASGNKWRKRGDEGGNGSDGGEGGSSSRRRRASSRRRHSFGADNARVAPIEEDTDEAAGAHSKNKSKSKNNPANSDTASKKGGARKKNRRLTF